MIRRILALAVAGVLALAGVASATTNGTYLGTSSVTISGFKATHPFSVKVKSQKVVQVSLIAAASCADLNGSAGIKASLKISKKGQFSGTMKFARFSLKLQGTFKGKTVTGSFTGTAKGLTSSCSVPKNTFKATS
jgi:hypothetical protein